MNVCMYVYNTDFVVVEAAAGPLPIYSTYDLNIHFSIIVVFVGSRPRTFKAHLRESIILSEDKTALLPGVNIRISGAGAWSLFLVLSPSSRFHLSFFPPVRHNSSARDTADCPTVYIRSVTS